MVLLLLLLLVFGPLFSLLLVRLLLLVGVVLLFLLLQQSGLFGSFELLQVLNVLVVLGAGPGALFAVVLLGPRLVVLALFTLFQPCLLLLLLLGHVTVFAILCLVGAMVLPPS